MNERQPQTNRQWSETLRCARIGRSQNDEKEKESEHDLGNERRDEVVTRRGMCPVSVASKAVRNRKTSLAAGN